METLKGYSSILSKLMKDVENSGRDNLVLMTGHFPLLFTEHGLVEAFGAWGNFSDYSLALASRVG